MGSISTVYTEADVATRLDAVAAPVTAKSARPGATTASEYVTVSVMGNVLVYCVDSHVRFRRDQISATVLTPKQLGLGFNKTSQQLCFDFNKRKR